MIAPVYVVDACRTPIGRYRGALSSVRPDDLAGGVVGALLARNPTVDPSSISEVVLGCANQAGEDNRNVARMAGLLAGLPVTVPGVTVNRLCGSGLDAVNRAAGSLALGHGWVAVAGGVESMSRSPFVLARSDEALPRRQELVDTTLGWRLVNPRMPSEHTIALGATAEVLAAELAIDRDAQDRFALRSHQRAVAADFASELVPVDAVPLLTDEAPRPDTTLDALGTLKPAFVTDGTVTAGNSSGLNDGAAAVLLATADGVERFGLEPMARIVDWAVAGVEPRRMGIGPVPAMELALERAGWAVDQLAAVELNEAFAAQALAVLALLPVDPEVVNPRGGAIALGHPLGCSGARILTTLVHELQPGERGAATMCIGVGQGIATLVERL